MTDEFAVGIDHISDRSQIIGQDPHGRSSHSPPEGSRMTPKARSIVEQLQQAIKRSGETQYAIAQATGISQSVLNRFINGERGISLDTAAKLCQYLDLDLAPRR